MARAEKDMRNLLSDLENVKLSPISAMGAAVVLASLKAQV